jgi:hypothetical protein
MNCLHCQADVTNGLTLCDLCQKTLVMACVNVAAYFADVDRIRPGSRVKVRSAYQSTPPPHVEPAFDAIGNALDLVSIIVYGWCVNLQDDRPGVKDLPATTEKRCGWLEEYTASIATLEWAAECLREMLDCERTLRRILDRADTGWYAGVCGNEVGREDVDGEVLPVFCERHLYGTVGSSWVSCPECGRTWDAGHRRTVMINEAREEHAPVSIIASATVGLLDGEISVAKLANRIDQWVCRGKLQSLGVRVLADGKPHRVYRIGDVFDLLGVEKRQSEPEAC